MTIAQKVHRGRVCFWAWVMTINLWAGPKHHLSQIESESPFCQKVQPDGCTSLALFEQSVREGCLNTEAYRATCTQTFCKTYCAVTPCPTGRVSQLCKIYCHDVYFKDLGGMRLLNACLMGNDHIPQTSAFHKSHVRRAHAHIDGLEKILRERDVLFHVDGLHLGSHGIVKPVDFRNNLQKAIEMTLKAHNILNQLTNNQTPMDLQQSAKHKVAASDEHAQYFSIVVSDLNREAQKIRSAILKRKTGPTSSEKAGPFPHPNPVFPDLVGLIQERESLLYIDAVKEQNGGIVRLSEFMEHAKRILSLTFMVNHIYAHLEQHFKLTQAHHSFVEEADKKVMQFINDVYVLNQDCHQLIRAIAGGLTYFKENHPAS